jgi:VWFA-related protein
MTAIFDNRNYFFRMVRDNLALVLLSWAYLAFSGGSVRAQSVNLSIEPRETPGGRASIHVNSDLVLVPVTVVDHDDRSVVGLEKERFRLYDNKVEQVITHFAMEDAPISVAFLLDSSASMARKIRDAREAISNFLNTANPDDEFLLVRFSDQADLLLGLTKETEEVRRHLGFIQPTGRTALLDAIDLSIREIRKAHNVRKALVIVSDGGDNCSRHTMHEIKALVRESDVQIYSLGIFDPWDIRSQTPEELAGPALLSDVSKQSGGRLFEIRDPRELPDVAGKIGNALRTQYLLGYSPAQPRMDGKYHRVEVKLAQPKGSPKLQASWRRGYYAPGE